jgi:hypothetical protein
MGLFPGRYVLSAICRNTSGMVMSGETPELDVEAGQSVTTEIVLRLSE